MDEIQVILDSLIDQTIDDAGFDDFGDFYMVLGNGQTVWMALNDDGDMTLAAITELDG